MYSKACKANQLGCDVNENILISNGRTHYTPHYVQLYIKFANLFEYQRINEIKMFKWVGSHLSWLHAQWIDKDGTNLSQDNTNKNNRRNKKKRKTKKNDFISWVAVCSTRYLSHAA